MALRAFVDDSNIWKRPVSVLAGYIATPNAWLVFSEEWEAEIHNKPSIDYFKMSEAASLTGEFFGWSRSEADKKISRLHPIIERHASHAVSVALYSPYFEDVFSADLPEPLRNP